MSFLPTWGVPLANRTKHISTRRIETQFYCALEILNGGVVFAQNVSFALHNDLRVSEPV